MNRTVRFRLNEVDPTPASLRANGINNAPALETVVNLGQLFLHYYFDSFPTGPPDPDPSSFEYLSLLTKTDDFRFQEHVKDASTVKRRSISTELGQAFCRWMLQEHFSIIYFAHLGRVIDKPTHAAFEGMRIIRTSKGDIPDYLCARQVTKPYIAEAKGRFSSIGFDKSEFEEWRDQFGRIRVLARDGSHKAAKGYIVATRFVVGESSRRWSTTYVEDPATTGEELTEQDSVRLGRVAAASHYGQIFRKIGILPFASALELGYPLTEQLRFQVPVWTCVVPPFAEKQFIGGFYRTNAGVGPVLTDKGWQLSSFELGTGHLAFVGLELDAAIHAGAAARGRWSELDRVPQVEPFGAWGSEFAWLPDGTVLAPAEYFIPTALQFL